MRTAGSIEFDNFIDLPAASVCVPDSGATHANDVLKK